VKLIIEGIRVLLYSRDVRAGPANQTGRKPEKSGKRKKKTKTKKYRARRPGPDRKSLWAQRVWPVS
jgi:hypothetical protein